MFIQEEDLHLDDVSFKQRKYLPYEIKVSLSLARIREFRRDYAHSTYISFSGGLDSTVLLDLVRKYDSDSPAVFCDTGLEFPEIKAFVKRAEEIYGNIVTIRPEKSFEAVLKEYGYPFPSKETAQAIRKLRHGKLCERYRNYLLNGDERGKIGMVPKRWQYLKDINVEVSDKCCDIMKKKPFDAYAKETDRRPYVGITQDESFRRTRQYERTGCIVTEGKHIQCKPLGFWTRNDVLRYIKENNLEYCSIYGDILEDGNGNYYTTGEQRTGCMFCLFGVHLESSPNRIQRLAVTHPQIYDYIMRGGAYGDDGVFRPCKGLGYRQLQETFHIDLERPAQISLFDDGSE